MEQECKTYAHLLLRMRSSVKPYFLKKATAEWSACTTMASYKPLTAGSFTCCGTEHSLHDSYANTYSRDNTHTHIYMHTLLQMKYFTVRVCHIFYLILVIEMPPNF